MHNKKLKWRIYIVGHDRIYDGQMVSDKRFNNDNYCFLNVGSLDKLENSEKYCCINQKDLPNYTSIGKYWTESEGIYNIWRSGIFRELDYIGFLHYDIEFRMEKKNRMREQFYLGTSTNITSRIERYIRERERAHISFRTHDVRWDYSQRIMADVTRPNEFVGDGRNCYHYILDDYNEYFHKSYTIDDVFKRKDINLCSCFLIDIKTFDIMMGFFDWLVRSHRMDVFDTEHQYRFQGNMAERYFGMFLLFEYDEMLDLMLIHMLNRDKMKESVI